MFNALFYATMPFRAIAFTIAVLIISLAGTMDRKIWDVCDFDGAWEWVTG